MDLTTKGYAVISGRLNALTLSMMTKAVVVINGVRGIVLSIEKEDGSGMKYNVKLLHEQTSTTQLIKETTVYADLAKTGIYLTGTTI